MKDNDFQWLADHGPELHQKYAGKWVAIHDGKVVGVGDTAVEASQKAETETGGRDFVLQALDAEADVIYGGV
jgi:hypothetical protein